MDNRDSIRKKLVALLLESISTINWQSPLLLIEGKDDNPTTMVDKNLHDYLLIHLNEIIRCPIISEENFGSIEFIEGNQFWVIDPIDGTLNLLAGSKDYGISIALVDGLTYDPMVSAVAFPARGEIFSAARGYGSFFNGKRINVLEKEIKPKIISIGIPGDAYKFSNQISDKLDWLIKEKWIIRQSGSAAMDICYTSLRNWRGFWEPNIFLWDFIGAELISVESGCFVNRKCRDKQRLLFDILITDSKKINLQLSSKLIL